MPEIALNIMGSWLETGVVSWGCIKGMLLLMSPSQKWLTLLKRVDAKVPEMAPLPKYNIMCAGNGFRISWE